MLFNSPEFLGAFLPLTLFVYFLLNKYKLEKSGKLWLLLCSLFFYAWWKPIYLVLLMASMLFNYFAGQRLNYVEDPKWRKIFYIGCLMVNLSVLLYFKYANFFVDNLNYLLPKGHELIIDPIILPLAISFFTFQKFAYITDSYKGETKGYNFLDFSLFVAFFPQLIAGPIVHHKQIVPQFESHSQKLFNTDNFVRGLYQFLMGLIKKIMIADTFAILANAGYAEAHHLSFLDSWITSLSYTIQLYFDFSGYSDMAIGAALMFNIKLPLNFDSPYKSTNIQDFWRRWHITLGNFLREYIYIPLGGNRKGEFKMLKNLVITFLIGGFWHGANWTFVAWGLLHGIALVIHRLWQKTGIKMSNALGIIITFLFANFAWVFFRALTISDAFEVIKSMVGIKVAHYSGSHVFTDIYLLPMMLMGVLLLFWKNPKELVAEFKPDYRHLAYMIVLGLLGLLFLNSITASDFLYFDF
ncbi:MAG: MBOAT family protein [Ferruginibacter sp.]